MNIIQKMKLFESQYTNAEYKVYSTIMKKPALVDQYAITGLAGLAGTSASAVLRFCQKLGYMGYKDFRFDMLQYLQSGKEEQKEDCSNPVVQIIGLFSEAISEIQNIDPVLLEQLSKDLASSSNVCTMGLYRSYLPAEKLRINLEDCGLFSLSSGDLITLAHHIYCMDDRSTVVLFSVSGHPHYYQNVLESILQTTSKVWLITTNPCAELKKDIKKVVVLPTCSYNDSYPLDDHTVMMAFVELISYFVLKMKPGNGLRKNDPKE